MVSPAAVSPVSPEVSFGSRGKGSGSDSETASSGGDDGDRPSAFITALTADADTRPSALDKFLQERARLTESTVEQLGINTDVPDLSDEELEGVPDRDAMVADIMKRLSLGDEVAAANQKLLSELDEKAAGISTLCDDILKGEGQSYLQFVAASSLGDCEDLMLEIFSHFDTRALVRASRVSKFWNKLAKSDALWSRLTKNKYGLVRMDAFRKGPPSWRRTYVRRHTTEKNWRVGPYERTKLYENTHSLFALDLTANGVLLAGGFNEVIHALSPESGQVVGTLTGHRGPVECISTHGNIAISGSRDEFIMVWDVGGVRPACDAPGIAEQDIRPRAQFRIHDRRISCCTWDGTLGASGGADHCVCMFDVETGNVTMRLRHHADSVTALQSVPEDHLLYSASLDKTVQATDTRTGRVVSSVTHEWSVLSMDVNRTTRRHIATGCADHGVYLWEDGRPVTNYTAHRRPVTCVKFALDGTVLVHGGGDNLMAVWDVKAIVADSVTTARASKKRLPRELYSLKDVHTDWLSALVCTPTHIYSASLDHTVQSWGFVDHRT